jgi:hypothetical protein
MGKRGRKHDQRSKSHSQEAAPDTWRLASFKTGVGRPEWQSIPPGSAVPNEAIVVAHQLPDGDWQVENPPAGTVIADMSKQSIGYGTGYPAYLDLHYTCSDCKGPSVFLARDQKRYYETDGNSIWAGAVRCRECRRVQREQKDASRQLGDALRSFKHSHSPGDALRVVQLTVTAGPMMGKRAKKRALDLARFAGRAGLDTATLIDQLSQTPSR